MSKTGFGAFASNFNPVQSYMQAKQFKQQQEMNDLKVKQAQEALQQQQNKPTVDLGNVYRGMGFDDQFASVWDGKKVDVMKVADYFDESPARIMALNNKTNAEAQAEISRSGLYDAQTGLRNAETKTENVLRDDRENQLQMEALASKQLANQRGSQANYYDMQAKKTDQLIPYEANQLQKEALASEALAGQRDSQANYYDARTNKTQKLTPLEVNKVKAEINALARNQSNYRTQNSQSNIDMPQVALGPQGQNLYQNEAGVLVDQTGTPFTDQQGRTFSFNRDFGAYIRSDVNNQVLNDVMQSEDQLANYTFSGYRQSILNPKQQVEKKQKDNFWDRLNPFNNKQAKAQNQQQSINQPRQQQQPKQQTQPQPRQRINQQSNSSGYSYGPYNLYNQSVQAQNNQRVQSEPEQNQSINNNYSKGQKSNNLIYADAIDGIRKLYETETGQRIETTRDLINVINTYGQSIIANTNLSQEDLAQIQDYLTNSAVRR